MPVVWVDDVTPAGDGDTRRPVDRGVDPCSLLVPQIRQSAGIVGTRATDGASGPACTLSGTRGAGWVLSFALAQSLEEVVDAYGGDDFDVNGVTGRAVKTGTTCRIAVALTTTGTMQLFHGAAAPLVGCNDTADLVGYALAQSAEVQWASGVPTTARPPELTRPG